MTKKCPPGVICFENITLIIFLVIAGIIIYLAYSQTNRAQNSSGPHSHPHSHSHSNIIEISHKGYHGGGGGNGFLDLIPSFGSGYTRGPADVLLNPYTPPLRDNRFNDQLGISALDSHSSGGGGGGVRLAVSSSWLTVPSLFLSKAEKIWLLSALLPALVRPLLSSSLLMAPSPSLSRALIRASARSVSGA